MDGMIVYISAFINPLIKYCFRTLRESILSADSEINETLCNIKRRPVVRAKAKDVFGMASCRSHVFATVVHLGGRHAKWKLLTAEIKLAPKIYIDIMKMAKAKKSHRLEYVDNSDKFRRYLFVWSESSDEDPQYKKHMHHRRYIMSVHTGKAADRLSPRAYIKATGLPTVQKIMGNRSQREAVVFGDTVTIY